MEIFVFGLLILAIFAALSFAFGADSRPSEYEHTRNW
jgi:hypothetical protein